MIKPELQFQDDEVYAYTPLPQYGEGIYDVKLVMTKDIFKECYKRWIESAENEDKENKDEIFDALDKNISPSMRTIVEGFCLKRHGDQNDLS